MKRMIVLWVFAMTFMSSFAQCGIENTAFKSGEFVGYDLYFNWKFVWMKVGTASMSTVKSTFKGQDAYRCSLITRGNSKLDNMFVMRDTLLSYTSMDLEPLYYRKGAREGKRYYVDELWYTYPKGNCHLKCHEINSRGEHYWKEQEYKDCIYDMMSVYLRARNFEASKLKVGDKIPLPIADASDIANSWLKYNGITNVKMKNSDTKYRCLVFSFIEREDGKNHELIRFYITDDKNHLPVRLDMFLSFGSAKAYLTGYKGLRNPMTSKVE
jgi:hypothetical protein